MNVTIAELTDLHAPHLPSIPELSSPDDLLEVHRQVMEIAHGKAGSAVSKPWTDVAAMMMELHKAWANRLRVHSSDKAQEAMQIAASRAFAVLISLLRQSVHRAGGADMRSELAVFAGWLDNLKMQAPARAGA